MTLIAEHELQLLAKHLQPGADIDEEEASLLALSEAKQRTLFERLRVLDDYLSVAAPTLADATRSATELKMSARNFYRLVSKLRDQGPVVALTRNFRLRKRPSAANDGLNEVADAALAELLRQEPDARWKRALEVVSAACAEAKATPPSEAAVRRRLLALRRAGNLLQPSAPVFGASWLVDQSAIDLPVSKGSGATYAIVTFIVDRSSRLILGIGLDRTRHVPESGLFLALGDTMRRIGGLSGTTFEISNVIRDLEWIVPEGMEATADTFVDHVSEISPDTHVTVSQTGPRRHGAMLLRIIGERVGPYRLLTRATASVETVIDLSGRTPVSEEKAHSLLDQAVRAWNREITSALGGVESRPISARRRARVMKLGALLTEFFAPILHSDLRLSLQNLKNAKSKR